MIPETVTGIPEEIALGNIKGDIGQTGYGFNTNLFDNWDFTHSVKRGSADPNYICDRWYRDSKNTEFSISNSGLLIQKISNNSYIKQNLPYISPGKYIISIITDAQLKSSFEFKICSADGTVYTANIQDPMEYRQTETIVRYIHFGIIEISEELIKINSNYPSVQIIPKEENKIIYRAKFEANIYRGEESNSSTIAQDVYQNPSYNSFITASSNENGVYTSPFLSNTITIKKEDWEVKDETFFQAISEPVTDAIGNCHIIVAAEPDSADEFADYSIICIDHNTKTGELVYRATDIPDKDIQSNILVVRY